MRGRGDLLVELRLLIRPKGVVGLVGAIAGTTAFAASYLAWYEVRARVDMLGGSQSRGVADLAGWQAHPWGWAVPALAIIAVVVGLAIAFDRPPPAAGKLLIGTGLGLATVAGASALLFPPVSRFDVAGTRLRELAGLAGRLPSDVELSFTVSPSVGLWLALGAAALLVAAGFAERDV